MTLLIKTDISVKNLEKEKSSNQHMHEEEIEYIDEN